MKTTYNKEIQEMISLLKEAAKIEILPRFSQVIAVEKGERMMFRDIVTEADIKAGEFILSRIRPKFPGSYSEEQKYANRFAGHSLIWQIDPIDGTDEFCHEIVDGYAMHAALLKKQEDYYVPVAGIIYLPGVDKLWFTDGSGEVFFIKNGQLSPLPHLFKHKLLGCIRKVDPNQNLAKFYQKLGRQLSLPTELVNCGGAGASISDLLEGKTNIYINNFNYSKEWDLAMAEPIIRALGGFICDLEGNPFIYNRKDTPEGEPYNLKGYMVSIVFKRREILPHIPKDFLVNRLQLKN